MITPLLNGDDDDGVLTLLGSDDEEGVSRVIPSIVTADPGGTSSSMMHPPLLGVAIAVIESEAMMIADTTYLSRADWRLFAVVSACRPSSSKP